MLKTANLDETLNKLNSQLLTTEQKLQESSQILSEKREEVIRAEPNDKNPRFGGDAQRAFSVELIPTEDYLVQGREQLNFAFSANKGSDFGSLGSIGRRIIAYNAAVKAIYRNTRRCRLLFSMKSTQEYREKLRTK